MRACIIGALALTLLSSAARATDLPPGGFTYEDAVTWLQDRGYQAKMQTLSDGTKDLTSAVQGTRFHIRLYGCKGDRCDSLQFFAGFATQGKFDATQMNEWNYDKRFVKAYIDKTNDPWLTYDIDLSPGGTYELLNDELATWNALLPAFVKQFGL